MIPFAIPWRLVGAAVGLALLVGTAWWAQSTIRTLESDKAALSSSLAVAEAAARDNAAALDTLRAEAARDMATVTASSESSRHRAAEVITIIKEIRHAPPAPAACTVAPRLIAALDRLRQPAAGAGAGQGSGAGEAARAAAGVR